MNHPNAAAGAVLTGPAALVVYLVGLAGLDMSNEVAVVVAGGVISAGLLVGRKGVRGVARIIWRGSE